jgi:hypothetical protein
MVFFSCHSVSPKKPSKTLPLDTVAAMMADCFFLESETCVRQWSSDPKDYALAKYDSIFGNSGIDKIIFIENVKYFLTKEKYAEKLINIVDEIVERRVAALRDSLNIE